MTNTVLGNEGGGQRLELNMSWNFLIGRLKLHLLFAHLHSVKASECEVSVFPIWGKCVRIVSLSIKMQPLMVTEALNKRIKYGVIA